jgi:uncharacterized protein YoaH (UPF0181 family)
MMLPQSSERIRKLKSEGAAKRKRLMSLVPDEFTIAQLVMASGMSASEARSQIQKMMRWNEVKQTSEYKTPRTYRKDAA